ncbi:kinase-like protein [Fomitiporia mediterranea MF3/22]|uniref:kinase-like protein n=1 Tax=Fomitiporia mediterranea (strain MF3/22) TaxID=694068 RepID=UPI00044072C5|nr:kinase-like protein [Fomitiporia mediterranea MF3/22]EJD03289.1 kinase-like protein [Fomitiporia mediterranea MF3/22]
MNTSARPEQAVDDRSAPPRPFPLRKRASDTQSPLNDTRAGQKPKLSCAPSSGFLPSTLGRSYCARFPPDHRLRSDFVRTYALDAELGSGGYGFVMTARRRQNGQEVAVKFIPKDKIPRYGWVTDESGKSIPKEAWFLSKVDHPAIVKFHELYEDNLYFYLVMELHGTPWYRRRSKVTHARQTSQEPPETGTDENEPPAVTASTADQDSGSKSSKIQKLAKGPLARPTFARRASHDLFECIEQSKHKRFSEDDAKYIFAQVVDVIDYLDQLGITHCDIKDENVVIDKNLKIKLVDFGSVVSVDPSQDRPFYKTFYGTAAYASPEIMANQLYQAAPAEIWAIGVLLSFLITGMSPFPTEEDKRNGRIVLDDVSRARMSDECYHLLQRCLDVDPKRRADIAEVKAHPWLAAGYERLYAERSS